MTQEEKDGVIWWAIDDALKAASSFYESMARSHITELVEAIKASLDKNGLEITEKAKPASQAADRDDTGGFVEKESKL